jgi:long-chain acyl-CoA synthetase
MSVYSERPWLDLYAPGVPACSGPEHDNTVSMFEATVARHPHSTALAFRDDALTWSELADRSDASAAALSKLGVQKDDRVVSYQQNVPEVVILMLAVWKCGAILVSASPRLRAPELRHVLADSGATALVMDASCPDIVESAIQGTSVALVIRTGPPSTPADPSHIGGVRTSHFSDLIAATSAAIRPKVAVAPGDVALITYTSGATAPSKGAMSTHESVVFNAQTYREWASISDRDVILGIAPLFHVTGLIGHIGLSLLTGAQLILDGRFQADSVLQIIQEKRPTFTVAAITAFSALWSHPSFQRRDVSSLQTVFSGGAPIPARLAREFRLRFGVPVYNIYGVTETTSPSHATPLGRETPVDPASGALSVGVPVISTVVRVVDDDGHDVPPGTIGELVTYGPQVSSGYWRQPDETSAAFPDGGIFTGDVGYMDAEGWFYIVDRKRDLVNASGCNA